MDAPHTQHERAAPWHAGGGTCALVVEGGGMRGAFSAGVLDMFLEREFNPFTVYGGASGGAMNLSSFLSRQPGRNHRIYRDLCTKPQFLSMRRFLAGGPLMDLDWLWTAMAAHEPFDLSAAVRHTHGKQVYFVATCVESGTPAYLTPDPFSWMDKLKASAAQPLMYRSFVSVDGRAHADGGVTDPLPAAHAASLGADTVVVIRTRPLRYRVPHALDGRLASWWLHRHPQLGRALRSRAEVYNTQARELERLSNSGLVITIAPPEPTTGRCTATSPDAVNHDYQAGRRSGAEFLESFQAA